MMRTSWILAVLTFAPVVLALVLALSGRLNQRAALYPMMVIAAVAVLFGLALPDMRLNLLGVLVLGDSALVINPVSRAASLLFGTLWLAVGLSMLRESRSQLPGAALLLTLSAALGLAFAEGRALVYAAMLGSGYGAFALISAGRNDETIRRAGRALLVLLVASDVLIFEVLLGATKERGMELKPFYLVLLTIALMLRGGMAPAHVWLPPALKSMRSSTMILVAAVPAASALFAAMKLLPGAVTELAPLFLVIGLAGTLWVTLAGLGQTHPRAMLGYATAGTAALLLLSLPAAVTSDGHLAALGLSMLACNAAALLMSASTRDRSMSLAAWLVLILHGLASGQTAWHSLSALPGFAALLVPVVALSATLLLSFGVFRAMAAGDDEWSGVNPPAVWVLIVSAALGLGLAWRDQGLIVAALWVALAALALGYALAVLLPLRQQPMIRPGDLLGPVEKAAGAVLNRICIFCQRDLPAWRDRFENTLAGLLKEEFWSRRIEQIDTRLQLWTATSVLLLIVAASAAFLLVR